MADKKLIYASSARKAILKADPKLAYCIDSIPGVDAVVLPCKIGAPVYVITYCRCRNPECFDNQHCHKKETTRTPKVLALVMKQQKGRKSKWDGISNSWEWKPVGTICHRVYQKPFELKMLTEVGKTVFLSLEAAQKVLEERRNGNA